MTPLRRDAGIVETLLLSNGGGNGGNSGGNVRVLVVGHDHGSDYCCAYPADADGGGGVGARSTCVSTGIRAMGGTTIPPTPASAGTGRGGGVFISWNCSRNRNRDRGRTGGGRRAGRASVRRRSGAHDGG